MDAILTKLRVWPKWKKLKRIVVSAAHEDSSTGVRAEDFCQFFAKSLDRNCEVAAELWPLTQLRTPKLRAIAAGEAAVADLIIISVHHGEKLPSEVLSWMDLWLKQKGNRPAVLIALFDPLHVGSSSSMQVFLEEVARKGNMEFLSHTDDKRED